jgi:hypothetical protein
MTAADKIPLKCIRFIPLPQNSPPLRRVLLAIAADISNGGAAGQAARFHGAGASTRQLSGVETVRQQLLLRSVVQSAKLGPTSIPVNGKLVIQP